MNLRRGELAAARADLTAVYTTDKRDVRRGGQMCEECLALCAAAGLDEEMLGRASAGLNDELERELTRELHTRAAAFFDSVRCLCLRVNLCTGVA